MSSYNICLLRESADDVFDERIDYCRAFMRMDEHKVSQINYKEIYINHGPKGTFKIIEDKIRKNNTDIVFISLGSGYEFPIEFFFDLRRKYFMVLYIGDDEHYFDKHHRYYSQAFDLAWTTSKPSVMRYRMYGVDAIASPPFYDLRGIKKISCEKKYDVCFVGIVRGKIGREEYLKYLMDNKVNVEVFSGGGMTLSKDEMNRVYSSSKIGLSFTGLSISSCLDKDITINRRIKQIKGRAHEIALTGTFVLSEYAPGIEDFFEIGSEIDVFHCEEELHSKVKYYLANDAVREKMALKAYNRVINDCDEVKGVSTLMSVTDAKIKNKKTGNSSIPIYKDPIFKKAYSSFHLFSMFEFMLKGMPKKALHELMEYAKYPLLDGGVFIWHAENYAQRLLANTKWPRTLIELLKKYRNKV